VIDEHIPQLYARGGLGPSDFTRDAKHGRDSVIAKRHDRAAMLSAGARNSNVAVNDGIGFVRSHGGRLYGSSDERIRRDWRTGSGKVP
jgi:hypothetical protein